MVAQNTTPTRISAGGHKPAPKKSPAKPQKKLWVVKLQRIPYGFFEKELLGYFRQFGNVLRIRVARSRQTGNHKGWAYVGFDNKSVAEIAAESMDGYLMFEQRLGCKVMKPTLIPKSMLKGPLLVNRPSYRGLAKKDAIARNNTTGKNDAVNSKRRVNNLQKTLTALRNMGVNYDFPVPGVKKVATPAKKVVDNDVQIISTPKAAPKVPVTPKSTPKVAPATPKAPTPKQATPKAPTPKVAPVTPKAATPKVATPKVATPKVATPKVATPKVATPKVATPKVATPKPATPKVALPETPVTTKKVVITEPIKTPQTQKLKKVENTPKFSPKTRAAKAAAAGTPLVKSTLSKTIQKSVAASARPAPLEKKPVAGKRGKKKSL